MELIEEREALFHVLTSTSNDKMAKGDQFTIDPRTRYPHYSNLPIPPSDVSHLYDSDTKPAAPTPRPASAGKQETRRIKIPGEDIELAVQHVTDKQWLLIVSTQPLMSMC